MANRYWVGGTASWDATAGTKWALTSGGAGGQAVPTSSDDVFFDAASGAVTITMSSCTCRALNMTGFTGTMAGGADLNIGTSTAGNLTFGSGMTITYNGDIQLISTTTGNLITFNGKTINSKLYFNGSGGGWTFQDACTISGEAIRLDQGTLNTNGQSVTIRNFATAVGTKVLTLGATTLTITSLGADFATGGAGLTLNANTSTVTFTAGTTQTFAGAGKTWNNVTFPGGGGEYTITGANTYNVLTLTAVSTVHFTHSITQTVTDFVANGSVGNVITIDSTSAGTAATLSKASGVVSCSYLSVKDSTATGGAAWHAGSTSTNVSGNTGWLFTDATSVKTINGLARAGVKTVNGLAIASVKTVNGLA